MRSVTEVGAQPAAGAACIDVTDVVIDDIQGDERKHDPNRSARTQDAEEQQRRRAADMNDLRADAAYSENRPKSFLRFCSPTTQVRDVFGDSVVDYFSLGKYVMLLMMLWTVTSMPILIKRSQQVQAWISENTISPSDDSAGDSIVPTVPWMYYVTFSAHNGDLLGYVFGMLSVNLLLALVVPAISYSLQQRHTRERRVSGHRQVLAQNDSGLSASHSNSGANSVGEVEGTARPQNDPLPIRRKSALVPTPMPFQRHRRILSQPMTRSEIRESDAQGSHAGSISADDLPPLPTKLLSVVAVPRSVPIIQVTVKPHSIYNRTPRYRAHERPVHAPSRRDALECTLPEPDEYVPPTGSVIAGVAAAPGPASGPAPILAPVRTFANVEYIPDRPYTTLVWRVVSVVCTLAMLACQAVLYIAITLIDPAEHSWLLMIRSTIFAAAYLVWREGAETLTVWENHKYLHRFRNSFLCKIVVLRLTSTVLLFYLTRFDFVRIFWFGEDAAAYTAETDAGNCQYIVNATQYAVTLASEFASTFVTGIVIPCLQRNIMTVLCRKGVQGDNAWMPSFEIVQETADLEHKKFLVMLAFDSFPLMACGAFFLYVWELSVDRFKLFYLCRPEKRSRTQFKLILVLMNSFSIAVTLLFTLLSIYAGRSDQTNCLFP
jgi:hypothetical protein